MPSDPAKTELPLQISPAMNRRNGRVYLWTQLLIYFSAPVLYAGVVQAAFLDKLGASATISNLPGSTFLLGAIFPFICSWMFSSRWEKAIVQVSFWVMAVSLLSVCLAVYFPYSNTLRIAVIIGQCLVMGMISSITDVYTFKCLARGTSEEGRIRALKYAYGLGPIAAVVGSLAAQALLDNKLPGCPYPYNFGVLYLAVLPCMVVCAVISGRYEIIAVPDEKTPSFFDYLFQSVGTFVRDRRLILTWLGYLLTTFALNAMINLSLYTREAVGRVPIELSGLIMALRFGFKALAGFGLASLAARYGARAAMIATTALVVSGIVWPIFVSGNPYLFAFGLMGAGELAGTYFLNYIVAISSPAAATRNLALMYLTSPLCCVAPAVFGGVADHFGFKSSFLFGSAVGVVSLAILLIGDRRTRNSSGGVQGVG